MVYRWSIGHNGAKRVNGSSLMVRFMSKEIKLAATAGRSGRARRLEGRAKREFWARIEKVGEISREFGVQRVAHPHAGSNLEFEDEVEELLAHTDPESLGYLSSLGINP
jgi:hypothetical protein